MFNLPLRRSGSAALFVAVLAALVIGCGGGGGGGGGNGGGSGAGGGVGGVTNAGDIGGNTNAGAFGSLQANSIYFIESGTSGYDLKYTQEPAASGDAVVPPTTVAGDLSVDTDVAVSADPAHSGYVFYAAPVTAGGNLAIYRKNATPLTSFGAQAITAALYDRVLSIQATRDGNTLIYVAEPTGDAGAHLYKVAVLASGTPAATPVELDSDTIYGADVNPAGTQVVYEKVGSKGDQLYARNLSASTSDLLTTDHTASFHQEPQYSKGGTSRVVFSLGGGSFTHYVIAYVAGPGETPTIIDPFNSDNDNLYAPTFNSDGTRVAFIRESTDASLTGIYSCNLDGSDLRRVTDGPDSPIRSIYWSTLTGRATGGGLTFHLNVPLKR